MSKRKRYNRSATSNDAGATSMALSTNMSKLLWASVVLSVMYSLMVSTSNLRSASSGILEPAEKIALTATSTATVLWKNSNNIVDIGVVDDALDELDSASTRVVSSLDILDEIDILSGGPQAKNLKCPPPLVAFQNVIVRSSSTTTNNNTQLIPNIMHLSFKSRCLPQDLFTILEQWRTKLPNHSIFFHDDEAVERLFQQDWLEFSELKRAMKCIRYKGAMKIDVWRVLLLYKHGGIYSDIDVVPGRYLREQTIRPDLSFFSFEDPWKRPTQWFMAAEPRHPMMTLVILQITQNLLEMERIRTPKLVFVTGPHVVKHAWYQFIHLGGRNYTDYFKTNFEYEGGFNKKVLKHKTRGYVMNKDKYNDIVTLYNSTTQVTRQERITLESGVQHWTKKIFHQQKKGRIKGEEKDISCRAYLKGLENGSVELYDALD
mmetsp:Transcript_23473/g.51381  ORF Transcript_23473/g.51381 Transcript_23473/m.51381 type:complete len:432 (-) Transcript_23473:619-1914(-)